MARFRDPAMADVRQAVASRRVGEGAKCKCGESRAVALKRRGKSIICYEDRSRETGRATKEKHHMWGKANSDATIEVGANDHRELSAGQYDWPPETLRNPSGSDALRAAAAIRGYMQTHEYIVDKCLRSLPEMLERLAKLENRERKEKSQCKKKTSKKSR
jgi:hypothetical protein